MLKFIKKVLIMIFILFIMLVAYTILFFTYIAPQYSENYQASLIDKVERLKSIEEPKIVLVGNSNLAFGINSKKIEEATGMPVVNLGLHGGLGNAFHEEIAKLRINKDDIIIICHSSFSDNDTIQDPELAWITIENHKELWEIIRNKDIIPMLKTLPNYMSKATYLWLTKSGNQKTNDCYNRCEFDMYGDNIYERHSSEHSTKEYKIKFPKINDTCINRINKLNKYVTDKGATLLIAAYPIASGRFTPEPEEYDNFQKELQQQLDCPIISVYKDYIMQSKHFFNTELHLTLEGADLRTDLLIKDIKKWMNE